MGAKGFRHGGDLAVNKGAARSDGSVYPSDLGVGSTAHDEINLVRERATLDGTPRRALTVRADTRILWSSICP